MKYYLAIDLGASSGRHIVGWTEQGVIKTKEVYRFKNEMIRQNGSLIWDIEALFLQIKTGIAKAFQHYPHIESLSIDTWAVDYVLLKNDSPILPCYAYRDNRTEQSVPQVHACIPFETLYARTGIQFQPFNTIYQLYTDKMQSRLQQATDLLMLPEYFLWRLTGIKKREYTNATSTGLVNAESAQYDTEILNTLGFPLQLFPRLTKSGTTLGPILPEIAKEVGGTTTAVLCATHDTASAVEGIPMHENAPFLSSGTWSLLGVKIPRPLTTEKSRIANFTNEGGIGYTRYIKNIMGLWIIQNLQKQMQLSFEEMMQMAQKSKYVSLFDVNDPRFYAPDDMYQTIVQTLPAPPQCDADLINCVYHSLAYSYRKALDELEVNTGQIWDRLYIVGGGARNEYLNRLTVQYTGKKVISLPIEATALGNLKVQMRCAGGI